MPRYKLIIEYDGTPFAGWQWQDDAPSVQRTLADAIAAFCGHPVKVTGAGRTRAWRVPRRLDVAAMQSAAQRLVGKHDFTTFRSTECQAKSPVKTLDRFDVSRDGDAVQVKTSARSFLHNQVRSMVGSLVLV